MKRERDGTRIDQGESREVLRSYKLYSCRVLLLLLIVSESISCETLKACRTVFAESRSEGFADAGTGGRMFRERFGVKLSTRRSRVRVERKVVGRRRRIREWTAVRWGDLVFKVDRRGVKIGE